MQPLKFPDRTPSTKIKATGRFVIVSELEQGRRQTESGIILNEFKDSDGSRRSRWAKVMSVGPKAKCADDLKPGEWVLVSYNRWTPGYDCSDGVRINGVDEEGILLAQPDKPDAKLFDIETMPIIDSTAGMS